MSKRHAKTTYGSLAKAEQVLIEKQGKPVHQSGSLKLRPVLEPKTPGQERYMSAVRQSDVTLCEGVVGTGKTFIAVGMAAHDILERKSKRTRLVIARPIVPAGEDMGFLPGEIADKAGPYMEPIYDAFRQFCRDDNEYKEALANKAVELKPIAFLRGMTLKNCWVIVDECQNATRKQIEMILGRLGENSRMILCGSSQQCDIGEPLGWLHACDKLSGGGYRKGKVTVCRLGIEDIVRHDLIAEMIRRLNDIPEPGSEPTDLDEYEEPDRANRYGVEREATEDLDWLDSRVSSQWCRS
jgi:phosphate starvation-inducible PhoH-like protein